MLALVVTALAAATKTKTKVPAPAPAPAPSPVPVAPAPAPSPSPITVPGAPTSSISISWCLNPCNTTTLTTATNAINTAAGVSGSTNGGCGAGCSARRGLKQTTGSTVVVNLPTGTTTVQAQALQNQISAGNLVSIGIPATAVVAVNGVPFAGTPSPVPFLPSSPQNPAGAGGICSTCGTTSGVVNGVTCTVLPCESLSNCVAQLNALASAGVTSAACCSTACTYRQRRSLSAVNGVNLKVQGQNLAAVCAILLAANVNANGCGKGSKKGLLGLLGLLGLIPLFLVLLLCCLCLLRRKRRGQAMLFSVTNAPAVPPAPMPHMHAPIVGGPASFHP